MSDPPRFDIRSYCERLVKASPPSTRLHGKKRFGLQNFDAAVPEGIVRTWLITDDGFGGAHGLSPTPVWWAFFGALLDEQGINPGLVCQSNALWREGALYKDDPGLRHATWLESVASAVVLAFENEAKSRPAISGSMEDWGKAYESLDEENEDGEEDE